MPEGEISLDNSLPTDEWIIELRDKHGLTEASTPEDVDQKVLELLEDTKTSLDAAEIVLGRRIDAEDGEVMPILSTPDFSPKDRHGLLLMQQFVESRRVEQGSS